MDSSKDIVSLAQLTKKILQDPIALQQLSDRVYELIRNDLKVQCERERGYGRYL